MRSHLTFAVLLGCLPCGNALAQIAIRAEAPMFALESMGNQLHYLRGAGDHIPSDSMGMLRLPQFTGELELTEKQIEQISTLQQQMHQHAREIMRGVEFGGNVNTRQLMREAQRALREQTEQKLAKIISSQQLKRLKQIQVQLQLRNRGVNALASEALAEALELSDEQRTELARRQREANERLQREMERLKKQYRQEVIEDVLSRSQLRKLKELSGKEYEIKKRDRRPQLIAPRP